MVGLVRKHQAFLHVYPDNSELEDRDMRVFEASTVSSLRLESAEGVLRLKNRFQLYRAFGDSGCLDELGGERSQSRDAELVFYITITSGDLGIRNRVGSAGSRELVHRVYLRNGR